MKVLILSCKTGQGHDSVANAIAETLDNRGHTCEIVDALHFLSDRTAKIMSWGHSFIYCHCPKIFTAGYEAAERYPKSMSEGSPAYWFFGLGANDLYEFCREYRPDVIVSTHVFASLMLTEAKHNYPLEIPCCFVSTDYTCSPGVLDCQMDMFFIPDDTFVPDFQDKPTFTSGIPVYQKFFEEMDKASAKAAQGLDSDKNHILMMCGSMGCGPIEEIARRIATQMGQDCTLSIVCGTNQRLYHRLSEAYAGHDRVRVHGFVHNVPQMMASADVYVTKPGGISTTEAMVKGLPMVLVDAVAGCEDHNMHYFQDIGGAVAAKEPQKIAQLCLGLIDDPLRREKMSSQLLSHRANGAILVCDYLETHTCQSVG